ncbi:MAG TPA: hypothetical protein GX400_10600 [Chloroflexi bacterium]|nr:hypothetical protein [Chloroflexota bacterium]
MTNSLDFTPAEWEVLISAPMLAGLLVGDLANPQRWITELYAVFDSAQAQESSADSVLIRAITERMLAREGDSIDLPADLPASAAEARAHLIAGCLQAVRLVSEKAPTEAPAFKLWLLQLARAAAAATKEGGFLGIGGTQISAEERTILHEFETALDTIQS